MSRTCSSRAVLWLLLAAALFMRAFVPQGFMAAPADGGSITVRVCGSGHLIQIPLGKDKAPAKAERAEQPCAFAGLGTPALPPPAPSVLPAPSETAETFAHAGEAATLPARALPRPPARGPPPTA